MRESFVMGIMLSAIILAMVHSCSANADTEFWGITDVDKDKIKIELNVDGCITSFTVPKSKVENSNVMDSMLATAEKRQREGCKGGQE